MHGGKRALEDENRQLREALDALGATEREQLRQEVSQLRSLREAERQRIVMDEATARGELEALNREVVEVRDTMVLQEVGIYEYQHPLDASTLYKGRLAAVRDEIKTLARNGGAVTGAINWTVNNSAAEGSRMIRDISKLMLRAYNNEADNAVRSMKPYALASSVARLDKARDTISRLGRTMKIEVTAKYHRLRVQELELTADYLAKVAEEKSANARPGSANARRKKRSGNSSANRRGSRRKRPTIRTRWPSSGNPEMRPRLPMRRPKLAEIEQMIQGVKDRAANIRAGYVYVISNIGSFGTRMVKVGMTRRLEPMDRVRELGDASVPFHYDVHALIFSEDVVSLETELHHALADKRVNWVNNRREFFYTTPAEVRALLTELRGELLSYAEEPEALEWRQSENARTGGLPPTGAPTSEPDELEVV